MAIEDSHQGEYRAGTISMTVLAVVFIILRFLARWKQGVHIGADDYAIVLSLVSAALLSLLKSILTWLDWIDSSYSYSQSVYLT